ncbi:hypothetical protein MKW94_021576 [Papaver nudicaule]|uniref:Bet v I/Major latex protein domain-containing protein n=1 Tax=Papaver nudicaule TaxID=74823 RepID=A0AA41VTF0_PAPNU|nr:hypothetical protein [Papaver nudicaule]
MFTRGAPSLPKYIPQIIHRCQVLPEDGEIRLGSIFRLIIIIKTEKITHTVIEGDLTIGYPSFAAAFHITPIQGGGSNKSMVKWSVEYEKENEDVPAPTSFMKLMDAFFEELDATLVEDA